MNYCGLTAALWLISIGVAGCAKPANWSPVTVSLNERTEVPVAFPGRGLPTLLLNKPTDARNASLAILDTGSPFTTVSPRYVEAAKLETRVESLRLKDAQGKERDYERVAHVKELKLGTASFRDFDAIVDQASLFASSSRQMDMLLGLPLFKDVLLTIDYPGQKLMLERGSLPEPNGKDVLPLRRDEGGHILVPVTLLGERAWVVLDTGHTGEGLLLSRYRLLVMKWASTPVEGNTVATFFGTVRARIGRMNADLTIGRYTVRRPIIGISFDDDVELLGADILREFVVTIDQKNDRVRLSRPSADPIEVGPVRRLGFDFTNATGAVALIPGSEAERAGLRSGDQVLSINGIPASSLNYIYLERLENLDEPLNVLIRRGDENIRLTIPLTTLVP